MKASLKDFFTLIIILIIVFSLITLAQLYGGIIMPAIATIDWCKQDAIEKHQKYLTALTAFSDKSRNKLAQEAQRRLEQVLEACEGRQLSRE